tara:strand:- start:1393 stop:1731 length:339 start_codon:yes stop_codon:yes gene_type:complete
MHNKKVSIGQTFDMATSVRCLRCNKSQYVAVGRYVVPCLSCMHTEFALQEATGKSAALGLAKTDLIALLRRDLEGRTSLSTDELYFLTEALANAISANNRKLKKDLSAKTDD